MSRPRTESTTSWSTAAAEESGEEGIDVDPYVLGERDMSGGMSEEEQRALLHSLSSSLVGTADVGFDDSAGEDNGGEISPIAMEGNGGLSPMTPGTPDRPGAHTSSSHSASAGGGLYIKPEAVTARPAARDASAPARRQRLSSGSGKDRIGHDLRVLDPYGQVDNIAFHRVVTDSSARGYDDAEAETSRSFLQVLRLRRRYLDASKQTVPAHLGSVVGEIKRIRRATQGEYDGGDPPTRSWGRAGMSPMATPTRPSSAEPAAFSRHVHAERADSQGSTGSSRDAVFEAATPPSEDASHGGGVFPPACYNPQCSRRAGTSSMYKCYSSACRQSSFNFIIEGGVFNVVPAADPQQQPLFQYVHVDVYLREVKMLQALVMDGPSKSIAYRRIQILKKQFELHTSLNETLERKEQTDVPHRDFYNVRKVDTHIHLSACMNQKHLLRFIKKKLKVEGGTVVLTRDGKDLTLTEVFKSMDMTAYDLSIDALDLHAGQHCFHRFDRFNTKYNPIGSSALREIFLKTNNKIKGRFYAEICKEVFDDLEESKYQQAEYRVSIYGRNRYEWDGLADWFIDYDMSSPHVRWLIQTPRLYHIYISNGMVGSFQDMLDNFFRPLFEASASPTDHPKLARFLEEVVGFDSVDDESKPEYRQHSATSPAPDKWTDSDNPPYSYYIYYWYANMSVLNNFRKKLGLNTFVLRPHAGEAGSTDHLISTYLCAEGISHGIQLRKAPVLQYLYYLAQIPMAMSPLSNNALFLEYTRNPFKHFFDHGLFVSLSTDDPLQFHMTKEPLIEEYAVASQVWRFSATDQAELCANSVRMSGFESATKSKWIGENWRLPGPLGNDIKVTNVPSVRLAYRYEALLSELQLLLTRSRL